MDSKQQTLWNRIEAFEFDEPGTRLRFAARLARENGWSVPHAERVLREYKRYCFLALAAGHPATPSEDVDQAWHLHLVYTRSYWDEFCPKVLGQPLHHGPTKGGPAESVKHDDWYRRTLASYQRLFGELPPTDIWPSSETRFSRDLDWKRVNWRENWIVPKRRLHQLAAALTAGVAAILLVGCDQNDQANPMNWKGPEFLGLYIGLFVAILIVNLIVRFALTRGHGGGDSEPKLAPYEMAYLQGGKPRLFLTATTDLTRRGHLQPVASREVFNKGKPLTDKASSIDREVLALHEHATSLSRAARDTSLNVTDMHEKLAEQGLAVPASRAVAIAWLNALPLLALLLLGVSKCITGFDRGKPITFLIVGCVVTFFVMLAFTNKPRTTGRGKRVLRSLLAEHKSWKNGSDTFNAQNTDVAFAVALFGVAALEVGAYSHLHGMMRGLPGGNNSSTSGGGCSSGSSGDGGGGGCSGGGCGGCGGGGGD